MSWNLEPSEIKLVASYTEVFNDVGYDSARHVAVVPGECDKSIGTERIGVVSVTPGVPQVDAADLLEAALQLPAIVRRVFAHGSGSQHEFVAESGRDRTACVEQGFQVGFGRLLKTQNRLAPVASVCVAARKQAGFGNPHAVFVAPHLNLRYGNDHCASTITVSAMGVNACRSELEVWDL